jgi:plasmid maintenance system killer protein
MKVTFIDCCLQELYKTGTTKKQEYKKYSKNKKFLKGLARIISIMKIEETVNCLVKYSFLHYEQLKHNYKGYSSVRIVNGMVERLIFRESNDGLEVMLEEINADHYGNK